MDRIWKFLWDMNGDGYVTIRDIPEWALWLFYYPGDFIISLILSNGATAKFFEMTQDYYGGRLSLALSLIVWLMLVITVWAAPIVVVSFAFLVAKVSE